MLAKNQRFNLRIVVGMSKVNVIRIEQYVNKQYN